MTAPSSRYPAPPWHTEGSAVFLPRLVPAASVRPPAGMTVVARRGWTLGILGYVEYTGKSPLHYRELLWMPALVEIEVEGRRVRGHFIEKMYVDCERSLAAGRELWAIPKQLAEFVWTSDEYVRVRQADTDLNLRLPSRRKPSRLALPVRNRMATLQPADSDFIRFRSSFSGRANPCRAQVGPVVGPHWRTLAASRGIPGAGFALSSFESTMHAPVRLKRGRARNSG